MNVDKFHDLDGTTEAWPDIYGSKIHMLSRLLRASVPVPKGFYFTLTASGGFDGESLDEDARELLKNSFDRLMRDSPAQKIF